MTLNEQLDKLADELEPTRYQDGETIIGANEGQDLESFQTDVQRLRKYASQGLIQIRRELRESMSGYGYVVRVHVRMGQDGVRWRKSMRN
jgi:hypothetical protein